MTTAAWKAAMNVARGPIQAIIERHGARSLPYLVAEIENPDSRIQPVVLGWIGDFGPLAAPAIPVVLRFRDDLDNLLHRKQVDLILARIRSTGSPP